MPVELTALPDHDAVARLFALEVYDRAAWHLGGNARLVPAEIIAAVRAQAAAPNHSPLFLVDESGLALGVRALPITKPS